MTTTIHALLDTLKLQGMKDCIDDVLKRAEKQGNACQDVLYELLHAQYHYSQTKQLNNRIKNAKLPWEWTLDTFPFKKQPGVNKPQIMGLAKLTFIERRENIVFIGKPGTGKTGLAMSLLRLALINGCRGAFYNAQDLTDELYASLADRTTSRLLKKIANYDVLVIDELGYLTLNTEQINIFFKLIDMRYQKKTTLITTNLNYPDWHDVFKQKNLVDAMLDRFRHFCTTIHINGPSLRTPAGKTKATAEMITQEKPEIKS